MMGQERKIEINAAIFPCIMQIGLGKPLPKGSDTETALGLSSALKVPDIMIDLPRGAYLLYLRNLAIEHNILELRLFILPSSTKACICNIPPFYFRNCN